MDCLQGGLSTLSHFMGCCPHCKSKYSSRLQEYPTFHLKCCDSRHKTFVEMQYKEGKQFPTVGKGTKIWESHLSNIHPSVVIGEDCVIHSHVWIGEGVIIGNNVKIQAMTFIPTGVTIEDNVFIGPGVTFTNDKHPPSGRSNWLSTVVHRGASIGARATILPGITIGEGARIGAGSVVTKSVPDNVTVCGNPAKIHNKHG